MYFFCKPKYNDTIKRKHTVNKSFVSIFTFSTRVFTFLRSVAEGNITKKNVGLIIHMLWNDCAEVNHGTDNLHLLLVIISSPLPCEAALVLSHIYAPLYYSFPKPLHRSSSVDTGLPLQPTLRTPGMQSKQKVYFRSHSYVHSGLPFTICPYTMCFIPSDTWWVDAT